MMKEVFKDIKGFEGLYQVSNLGRVKSLSRVVYNHLGARTLKEKILKGCLGSNGYYTVNLMKDGKYNAINVHQLVAMAFLGHEPCGHKLVVDHIDHNRQNNRVDNLQVLTMRQNSSKRIKEYTSKYIGVSKKKGSDKWFAFITINGKNKNLGTFSTELRASIAYELALLQLDKFNKILA